MTRDLISAFVADPESMTDAEHEALVVLIENDPEHCRRLRELLVLEEALSAQWTPHRAHFPNQMRKHAAMQESGRLFVSRLAMAARNLPVPTPRAAAWRWWTIITPLAAALMIGLGCWFGLDLGRGHATGDAALAVVAPHGAVIRHEGTARAVVASTTLTVGDEVAAGDTEATIACLDGTVVVLEPRSTVAVLVLSAEVRELVLRTGGLSATVAHQGPGRRFVVRTAQAETRVVGTRFTVRTDGSATHLEVQAGLVAFTDLATNATTSVPAGGRADAGAPGAEASSTLIDDCDHSDQWVTGSDAPTGSMTITTDAHGHAGGCLSCAFSSPPGVYPWAMRFIAPGRDCRADVGISFWMRGTGDGHQLWVQILDFDTSADDLRRSVPQEHAVRFAATVTDDRAGWRQIEIPFSAFVRHHLQVPGSQSHQRPLLADIVGVVFVAWPGQGSFAIDDLVVYRR
ncbi:MAG: FecR domain-containing protein [Planctomycetes bacterium]|nr:FecR domain-containing protein [Planctomycetota bacterium]